MKNSKNIERRFNDLLERFRNQSCSLEELYDLQSFFEREELSSVIRDKMIGELEQGDYPVAGSFDGGQLFETVNRRIEEKQRRLAETAKKGKTRQLALNWIQMAAAVVVSFVLGGTAIYFISSRGSVPEAKPSYCEVVSPLGSISRVTLPDSSVVWLNAGSKLKYSTQFNVSNRDLSLEGEGYFEVAKNKELPFTVDAFGFQVRAVGTEFNVKAYADEETIETLLVEGKVELEHRTVNIAKETYLNPKFKATFYKSRKTAMENGQPRLVISPNNDPLLYTSWKDDRFVFKSVVFKDLMLMLGRKYNVTFQLENKEIESYRFTGTLEDESIEQVMEVIRMSSPITYEINGKKVIINKDFERLRN
ncbi:FecR family protein [Mangrovibacterium lignilyticum]|uniref:FecR family protein n=1 Tax=Mangrovibacterium lignilyticum TaxID=2668052 RepID=UPI0013D80045|nr:FecR family protein [Mangrovibacterium lignilyticum]